jgi:neutral ceramidase
VTLPGEVTTVMGQRIEQRVSAARTHHGPTIGIGLAGEYLSYFTTPEEYDLQHYEGASMMYGRLAGEAMAEAAEQLARERRVDGTGDYRYRGRGSTSVAALGRKVRRAAKGSTEAVHDTLETQQTATVTFDDLPAQWDSPSGHTTPRVRVEAFAAERGWVHITDDEDDTLVTHVTATARARWTWAATWLEPFAPLDLGAHTFRFSIERTDGTRTCSTPFELARANPTVALRLESAACDEMGSQPPTSAKN